jgi:Ca-activated chloride channel family protein
VLTVATTAAGAGLSPEPVGGCLEYIDPETEEQSGFPLEHTSVQARISGTIADVTVTQRFSNPLKVLIEAVYVFPLPDRAAVDDMSIRIGERLIKGEIHRREEARRIYLEAVEAGHVAGLLDQERPNIFTQRLANILPGESIEVEIHYVEDLHYDHGDWKMVIPTVVGPRYIPGSATGRQGSGWSPDTDQVSDASRITPPVLPPGKVSGHHIDITVDLDPGFTIGNLESPSHEVTIRRRGSQRATVSLQPLDTVPNKDFELVWRTGGPALSTATIAHKTGDFGYVTLILQPPAQPRADQIVPREVVFVLDTSGSMSGEPIGACKQLVRKALKKLREGDTFRLIQFANGTSMLDADALPATAHTIERALSFLNAMRGSGGTELLEGVRAALDAPKD